jgi:SAM-dependent methyltransferase
MAADSKSELHEGIVLCEKCGANFPVVAGVPIFVTDLPNYFRPRYSSLMAASSTEQGPSQQLLAYLQREGIDCIEMSNQGYNYETFADLSKYVSAHYDQLADVAGRSPGPFAAWVRDGYVNLYDLLCEKLFPLLGAGAVALDLGSNVGGMSYRLAPRCQKVFGVDLAFRPTLAARKILLHQPTPLMEYKLVEEGRRSYTRRLDVPKQENVEFIVASATELPFAQRKFDLVTCSNVIDCVPDPKELVSTMTTALKKGGLLVVNDPYAWHVAGYTGVANWLGEPKIGVPERRPSAKALRDLLAKQYKILWEEDHVPWLLREYGRCYHVWLNHCLIARKRQV